MDDRNAQVGWTEAQWNRVREAVLREWQRVRVAGSFLPTYTNLPPSTQVVPSERIKDDGKINDSDTIRIVELSASIDLSRQQVLEDDLSDALLLLRRAATALARAEDEVIFKGQSNPVRSSVGPAHLRGGARHDRFAFVSKGFPLVEVDDGESVDEQTKELLVEDNPSATGLIAAAGRPVEPAVPENIVTTFATALTEVDKAGYGKPYVAVLGQRAFVDAHTPVPGSLVLPADRIEPMIGQKLMRATALDSEGNMGLLISLAGDGLDLVLPVSATPSFTHVNNRGHYVFRVYERFALRVKDPTSIKKMRFHPPVV